MLLEASVEYSNNTPTTSASTPKSSAATSLLSWKTTNSPAAGEPDIVIAEEYAETCKSSSVIQVSVTFCGVPTAVSIGLSFANPTPARSKSTVCVLDPPVVVQYSLNFTVPASQLAGVAQLNCVFCAVVVSKAKHEIIISLVASSLVA
uniref:Uncharacterized protein n=1 Tax=uncultured marine virus TaxID=186617 RepID=A0A0F7LA90_9VIRU|nr:hypothetical protein [uncultured marine virus]